MKIDDIKPYGRNARHNEKAVPVVAESIKEFGLKGQIVLESRNNHVIVAGHTRWAACKSLGWDEIPDDRIDYCDGLTEEQIKAFRLADNRTGEVATWNKTLLQHEIKSLGDLDMSRFKFDFKSKNLPYGAERLKTDKSYNLDLVNIDDCGESGMPELAPCDFVPSELLSFNYCKTAKEFKKGVHFFIDDYQFERLWNRPKQYVTLLKKFECVFTPDFSLYLDMPYPMQQWNIYRSRALGIYWQREGINVIPTLSWSTPESYSFCFDGIPKNATVATSTVGVKNDEYAMKVWHDGMAEAMERLHPKRVILYGGNIGFDFDCEVIEYKANTAFKE